MFKQTPACLPTSTIMHLFSVARGPESAWPVKVELALGGGEAGCGGLRPIRGRHKAAAEVQPPTCEIRDAPSAKTNLTSQERRFLNDKTY